MKAQAEVPELIMIVAVGAFFVLFMSQIPKVFKDYFDTIALGTSEIVASDLAGLISISAAAPQDIVIEYHGLLKDTNYTIELEDRTIKVDMIVRGEPKETHSKNTYAVDDLQKTIVNHKNFEIEKKMTGLIYFYSSYDFRLID